MRISLIIVFASFIFLNASCQENKKSNLKKENNLAAKKPTTLDSLQGRWFLEEDKKGELKIVNDTVFNIYENEIVDKATAYISNKCSENTKELNKSNKNGRFLITYSDDYMCYEIESMSSNKLVLFYSGNTLIYMKGR